jgi:hypothetical protein
VNWDENNWKNASFEKSTGGELHAFLTKQQLESIGVRKIYYNLLRHVGNAKASTIANSLLQLCYRGRTRKNPKNKIITSFIEYT